MFDRRSNARGDVAVGSRIFVGREGDRAALADAVTTPGKHCVVIGDRRVGKTALVHLACADFDAVAKFVCQSDSTFIDVARAVLTSLGVDIAVTEEFRETGKSVKGEAKPLGVGFGTEGTQKDSVRRAGPLARSSDPWGLTNTLREIGRPVTLILDDFERMSEGNETFRSAVLAFMKFSAAEANIHVIAIGAGNDAQALLGYDLGLARAISVIHVRPLAREECFVFLNELERANDCRLAYDVKQSITEDSLGYPYYLAELATIAVRASANASAEREVGLAIYLAETATFLTRVSDALPRSIRKLGFRREHANLLTELTQQDELSLPELARRHHALGFRSVEDVTRSVDALAEVGVLLFDQRQLTVSLAPTGLAPLIAIRAKLQE